MQRNLDDLVRRTFDLVVIGGGIAGVAAACDAARRGLEVALIERSDFAAASSSNLFKIAHGGIRYLQHGDLVRLRQSARSRNLFLRLAPHLVRPLDIVVPTRGWGLSGRLALRSGLLAYDAATLDLHRMIDDPAQSVPFGRIWGKAELEQRFPWLPAQFTGAGIFTEGHITSPARVVLAFAQGAAAAGASVANRVEATGFVLEVGRLRAVEAVDRLTGERLRIESRLALDCSGPYAPGLSLRRLAPNATPHIPFSRDAWFLVGRRLVQGEAAIALPTKSHDPDAVISRGSRHLFLVPWRDRTMVGVWHKVYDGPPDDFSVAEGELARWVNEVAEVAPGLGIRLEDVELVQAGLVPFGENDSADAGGNLRYGHRSHYFDHAASGAQGCASLVAVRYTTAVLEAIAAVDRLTGGLERNAPPSCLADCPLPGGDIDDRAALLRRVVASGLSPALAAALVSRHGSRATALVERAAARPSLAAPLPGADTLGVEIAVAVEDEMAQDLADILLRRTETLTAGPVDAPTLETAAAIAGAVAGWGEARRLAEIARVKALMGERLTGRAILGRPFSTLPDAAPQPAVDHASALVGGAAAAGTAMAERRP